MMARRVGSPDPDFRPDPPAASGVSAPDVGAGKAMMDQLTTTAFGVGGVVQIASYLNPLQGAVEAEQKTTDLVGRYM